MRYKDLTSFFRHLKDAAPNHLCKYYLVIVADAFERKKIIEKMISFFSFKNLNIERYSYARPFQERELDSPSLFGGDPLIIVDDFTNKSVSKTFFKKNTGGTFFFASSSKKDLNGFDRKVEELGVVFDLSSEKPWDKKERLEKQLKYLASKQGVQITQEALQALFIRLGIDPSLLEQEMNKLILYAKDKREITLEDVQVLSTINHEISSWQLAEQMIWEMKKTLKARIDSDLFFPLIGALRSQLRFGYKLAILIDQNCSAQEIQKHFPKIWPKTLEKKKNIAKKKGACFFQRALVSLYEIEILSKDKVQNYRLLIERFNCNLQI